MAIEAPELAPAGIVSRIGKFTVGIVQLDIVYEFLVNPEIAVARAPIENHSYYAIAAIALCLLPWTVNLGFNQQWGKRPLFAALAALGLASLTSQLAFNGWWGPPVSLLVYVLCLYVHGHMGASHVLASIIGTPGCEMRALSDLAARVRRDRAEFVPCPGFWTPLDNWERRLRHRRA